MSRQICANSMTAGVAAGSWSAVGQNCAISSYVTPPFEEAAGRRQGPPSAPGRRFRALRRREAVTRCAAVPLLVSASPGGAVFCREFLLGDVEVRHRRFEIVVLEFTGGTPVCSSICWAWLCDIL